MLQYFVFGDSISLDKFPMACDETPGFPSLLHKNDDAVFPEFTGKDLKHLYGRIQRWEFAVDGDNVARVQKWQIPYAERRIIPGSELIATLTIGGNDLLQATTASFKRLATQPWRLIKLQSELLKEMEESQKIFRQNFRTILERLCRLFPVVLVGNVYDPTDGTGLIINHPFSAISKVAGAETVLSVFSMWNTAITKEVEESGAVLVDIRIHFMGHGSHYADKKNPHYHPDDPTLWLFDAIEPNGRGASEIRRLFWEAIQHRIPNVVH